MNQKKTCSNCIKGVSMPTNKDILCKDKGVVSPDYTCSKHRYAPELKSYKEMKIKCIDCENFIPDLQSSEAPSTNGICQLFSYRQFDGTKRNACSKFVKKTIPIVS